MGCACGCLKVENRDLGLCATCNKLRRASQNPIAVKAPKPIAAVSPQRAAALAAQRKAYKTITARCCEACGTPSKLTNSHVLTQKQFPGHMANPQNIVKLCLDCHELWEHNKPGFRINYPEAWALKMHIMQELEPAYYEQFKLKHPELGGFKN
jgi:hypothetical protein